MKIRKIPSKACGLALAVAIASTAMSSAALASGPSGANVTFQTMSHIGEVVWNPYKIAPLTAVVRNGGYEITDAHVRIVPKNGGREIAYDVSRRSLLTYAGIPIFGLYPDYLNTVEITYTRTLGNKSEKFVDRIQLYCPPVYTSSGGTPTQTSTMFTAKADYVADDFKDRLYLVNNQVYAAPANGGRFFWNNPTGGALDWDFSSEIGIIDTAGDIRWYLMSSLLSDPENPWTAGYMMGFQQNDDGMLSWGFGQRYVKYDLLGREVFNRRLPSGYADYSHGHENMPNGHQLLRVASADYRLSNNKRVRTVRDVIIEVDQNGSVVDEWKLMEILDPYRDTVLKVLDQGAVCLNIDASKAGQTISEEELRKQDESDLYGDVTGVGPGRNWAHVNSIDYDPSDDSIIISSRHQSAVVKIGRDKKVKWILASPEGWRKPWSEKLLTPVDAQGKPLKCEASKCEGGFDWTWTQHTAWRIDQKSDERTILLTVFDNGDGRGMEQPALADEKYTRGVIYKIDQEKMTVQQVWEVGKKEGHDYYSPVTGLCQYQPDKNSIVVYYSTVGLSFDTDENGVPGKLPSPYITEYRWGETKPAVKIDLKDTFGYQAFPISLEKAFAK